MPTCVFMQTNSVFLICQGGEPLLRRLLLFEMKNKLQKKRLLFFGGRFVLKVKQISAQNKSP